MVPLSDLCFVLGAALFSSAMGYYNSIGNFASYAVSFMNASSGSATWFSSTVLMFQSMAAPMGGFIYKKCGVTPVVLIGMVLSSGGILLTRFSINYGLGPFILTHGIIFGTGMGLPYSVLITASSMKFPKWSSYIIGIINASFAIGGIALTYIQSTLVNPNNLQVIGNSTIYPEDVHNRIHYTLLVMSAITGALELIGTILMWDLKKKKAAAQPMIEQEWKLDLPVEEGCSVIDSLRGLSFYVLFLIECCFVVPMVIVSSSYKLYGIDMKLRDPYLTYVGMANSVFDFLGCLFWSWLESLLSFKFALLILSAVWGISLLTYPFLEGSVLLYYLYPIWTVLSFFCMTAPFVLIPASVMKIFGSKNMAIIYGLVYLAMLRYKTWSIWLRFHTVMLMGPSCFCNILYNIFWGYWRILDHSFLFNIFRHFCSLLACSPSSGQSFKVCPIQGILSPGPG